MRMTEQQRLAAQEYGRHVGVSAGAGSGKTSVMVERVVGLISRGVDVRSMLLVTFTVNATEGIRSRIRRALSLRAEQTGDPALRRQISLVGSAGISTIHAFCLDLVREFFPAAGVDPLFSMAGELQMAVLSTRCLDRLMEETFQKGEDAFYSLVDRCGGERGLRDLILRVDRLAQTLPDPADYCRRLPEPYLQTGWIPEEAARAAGEYRARVCAPVEEALRLLERSAETPGGEAYLAELTALRDDLSALFSLPPGEGLANRAALLSLPRIIRLNKEDPAVKAEVQRLMARVREGLKALAEDPFCCKSEEENRRAMESLAPQAELLRTLCLEYRARLDEEKRLQHLLEFSDVEHLALRILRTPGPLEELRARYTHVFVDEYQDVSPLQQAVLDALPGNHFFVGDIKQSIYGFRDAEPTLFLRRFAEYGAREADCLAVQLRHNFRSSPEILSAVNGVFSRCMTPELGRVSYADGHALIPGRAEHGAQPRILLAPNLRGEGVSAGAAQGRVIAREIARLHGQGRRYGEMVILMRSIGKRGAEIKEALRRAGIPAVTPPMTGYFDAPSIHALMGLLRHIDNPLDDAALIAALALYGLDGEALAAIRLGGDRLLSREDGASPSYCQAAEACARAPEEPLSPRLTAFFAKMAEYRRCAAVHGVERLLLRIKEEFAGPLQLYALSRDNLSPMDAVIAYAREFDARSYGDLYAFLQVMERILADDHALRELPIPPGAAADAVRIMTIHASKGLEFPVVFLAGAESRFHPGDLRGVAADRTHGAALPLSTEQPRENCPLHTPIARELRRKALEEELRVLYVALTRAEQELFVVGTGDADTVDSARETEPERATCFLDWILGGAEGFSLSILDALPKTAAAGKSAGFLRLADGDAAAVAALRRGMHDAYPHQADVLLPQRATPSGIGKGREDPPELERPRFAMESGGFTGAERGTILHRAMMLLDLPSIGSEADVVAQMASLTAQEQFTPEEAAAVDAAMVLRFRRSDLYQRIAAAKQSWRELPFNVILPARELLLEGESEVMVQGIVDLAFEEDGGVVIVDYKSDRLPRENAEAVMEARYRHQMRLYRMAVERVMGMPVKEVVLFLLQKREGTPYFSMP